MLYLTAIIQEMEALCRWWWQQREQVWGRKGEERHATSGRRHYGHSLHSRRCHNNHCNRSHNRHSQVGQWIDWVIWRLAADSHHRNKNNNSDNSNPILSWDTNLGLHKLSQHLECNANIADNKDRRFVQYYQSVNLTMPYVSSQPRCTCHFPNN